MPVQAVVVRVTSPEIVLRAPPAADQMQGQSWQTGFFELARRDKNMKVRYFWKVVLKF